MSSFRPITQLARSDADVALVAVYNYNTYLQLVSDPLFSATSSQSSQSLHLSAIGNVYTPDDPARFLAATIQLQACHSSDFANSCTPLMGSLQLVEPLLDTPTNLSAYDFKSYNANQLTTLRSLAEFYSYSTFTNAIASMGEVILVAWGDTWGSTAHVSAGLRDNQ